MTFKQMRAQVQAWLGLQDQTTYDETGLITDKLYEGTLDLLSRTRCVVRCVELTTTNGQAEYVLDHSILGLVDVEDGARRRLRRDEEPEYGFTLIRSDLLRIVPTPSEDGMQVKVWGVMRPIPMAADPDSPSDENHGAIPEEYHDAIVLYAMWKLADYADDGQTQGGEYYRVLYEGSDGRSGRLGQIKALVNKRGTARAPRARVRLSSTPPSGSFV